MQDVGTRGLEKTTAFSKKTNICKGFTPEQIHQLSTTYRERRNKEKSVSSSPAPTLVDPSHVSVLGKVERGKAVKPEATLCCCEEETQ